MKPTSPQSKLKDKVPARLAKRFNPKNKLVSKASASAARLPRGAKGSHTSSSQAMRFMLKETKVAVPAPPVPPLGVFRQLADAELTRMSHRQRRNVAFLRWRSATAKQQRLR